MAGLLTRKLVIAIDINTLNSDSTICPNGMPHHSARSIASQWGSTINATRICLVISEWVCALMRCGV